MNHKFCLVGGRLLPQSQYLSQKLKIFRHIDAQQCKPCPQKIPHLPFPAQIPKKHQPPQPKQSRTGQYQRGRQTEQYGITIGKSLVFSFSQLQGAPDQQPNSILGQPVHRQIRKQPVQRTCQPSDPSMACKLLGQQVHSHKSYEPAHKLHHRQRPPNVSSQKKQNTDGSRHGNCRLQRPAHKFRYLIPRK